jgi:hypothetical protein
MQSRHDPKALFGAAIHDYLLEAGYDPIFASAEFRRALRYSGISAQRAWWLATVTIFWTGVAKPSPG